MALWIDENVGTYLRYLYLFDDEKESWNQGKCDLPFDPDGTSVSSNFWWRPMDVMYKLTMEAVLEVMLDERRISWP